MIPLTTVLLLSVLEIEEDDSENGGEAGNEKEGCESTSQNQPSKSQNQPSTSQNQPSKSRKRPSTSQNQSSDQSAEQSKPSPLENKRKSNDESDRNPVAKKNKGDFDLVIPSTNL